MEAKNYEITEEQYKLLQRGLGGVAAIQDWGEMIGNIAAGLKARAAIQDPDCFDAVSLSTEVWREQNLFELLSVFQSIHEQNNGMLNLPEFPPTKPMLSRGEAIALKANEIICRRLNLDREKLQHMKKFLLKMHSAAAYGKDEITKDEKEAYEETFTALNSIITANISLRRGGV